MPVREDLHAAQHVCLSKEMYRWASKEMYRWAPPCMRHSNARSIQHTTKNPIPRALNPASYTPANGSHRGESPACRGEVRACRPRAPLRHPRLRHSRSSTPAHTGHLSCFAHTRVPHIHTESQTASKTDRQTRSDAPRERTATQDLRPGGAPGCRAADLRRHRPNGTPGMRCRGPALRPH